VKRLYIFIVAGMFILTTGLFFIYPWLERTLYIGDVPHKADAVIVLSGDPEPYFLRTRKAVELYKQGYTHYIIFSGYGSGGDNAVFLSRIAMHYNISKQAIIIEPDARTTYENFLFSKPIILKHKFTSILIVTSPYHQLRAYLVAKKEFSGTDIKIYNCASNSPDMSAKGMVVKIRDARFIMMEYLKLLGYYMLGRV
jgi:uncharacterized SAM-binding protein YcdF (DUF218 family)